MANWDNIQPLNWWLLQVDLAGHSNWMQAAKSKPDAARARAELAERLSSSLQHHGFDTAFWAGDGGLFTCRKESVLADNLYKPIDEIFQCFQIWKTIETTANQQRDQLNLRVTLHTDEVYVHANSGYWYSDELSTFLKFEREIALLGSAVITQNVYQQMSEEYQNDWGFLKRLKISETTEWQLYQYKKYTNDAPKPDTKSGESNKDESGISGVISYQTFKSRKRRNQGELFAAELLTRPVFLSKQDGRISVRINRTGVENVVISNPGKKTALRTVCHTTPRRINRIRSTIFGFHT
jgi:hypothetical protein